MEFNYAYRRSSQIDAYADRTELSFSPDTKREPTYFSGKLGKSVLFREAMSALHDVVVSDLRFLPRDKSKYKVWAAQQELVDIAQVAADRAGVAVQIKALNEELQGILRRQTARASDFVRARQRYFDYLYQKDRDAWIVLDPVITVHPDEVFFECFSQDESTYGRLGASYEVFDGIGAFACGTTNIDYSAALYEEFQKIRSYKTTRFEIDASGFEVKTHAEEDYKEVKIDLPDSWVRGFLQVSSAMALPTTSFELHPMDMHNFLFVLRRKKEKKGPRAMRYLLVPGEPVRVFFEPWNVEVVCARSIYHGPRREEIRVWGRRRLLILSRLLPIAQKFTVHLLGQGLPSFYIADLGHMAFTLGLSGWTANDWSTAGNFDLMAPRAEVDPFTRRRVFEALKEKWFERPGSLADRLKLPRSAVLGAMGIFTQAGRAIYDLNKGVYRVRELTRDPLPMDRLRFSNEREERATRFLEAKAVTVGAAQVPEGTRLQGIVRQGGTTHTTEMLIDSDARLVKATCTCSFYVQNKLFKGPCEHMLATRLHEATPISIVLPDDGPQIYSGGPYR